MTELELSALEWAWSQDELEWRAFCVGMVVASLERNGLTLEALVRSNNGNGDEPAKLECVAQAPSEDAADAARPL